MTTTTTTTTMLICLEKRLRRRRRQLKNVQLPSRHLARRKNLTSPRYCWILNPGMRRTDMKKLEEAVRAVQMEGLLWGASKLVPVGYGIKKLQIMLTIVDDLVSVDTLIEEQLTVEPINEYVQSCDIVAFNKNGYFLLFAGVSIGSCALNVLRFSPKLLFLL